jgi:hypothetical protein
MLPICPWSPPVLQSCKMPYGITQHWCPPGPHPCIQEYKPNWWVPDPFSQISIKQAYHYFLVASGICCGTAVRYQEIAFIHRLHPSWSWRMQCHQICDQAASPRLDHVKIGLFFPWLWWFGHWHMLCPNWHPQQHSIESRAPSVLHAPNLVPSLTVIFHLEAI